MRQPLYILSSCSISAQHNYDADRFLQPMLTSDNSQLYVTDPDYTKYISPVAIRRMSRFLKRGITAGMRCLEDAGVTTPDAIILGTARGSVTDMEVFLRDMITLNEGALAPTSFIQSTYNSINGWIAMNTKCTGYNQAFVHRGFSLELTLFDAQLYLAESAGRKTILTGGFDELTPEYYTIRTKIDYYKQPGINSATLLQHYDTAGSVAGEGAHFFTVSNDPTGASCAVLGVQMLQQPTAGELQKAITDLLEQNNLTAQDVDIMLTGMNGDNRNKFLFDPIIAAISTKTTIAAFKHLSGEYDTASGFGLWLAHFMLAKQQVPSEVVYKQGTSTNVKTIVLCNVTMARNASVMLVQKVEN